MWNTVDEFIRSELKKPSVLASEDYAEDMIDHLADFGTTSDIDLLLSIASNTNIGQRLRGRAVRALTDIRNRFGDFDE